MRAVLISVIVLVALIVDPSTEHPVPEDEAVASSSSAAESSSHAPPALVVVGGDSSNKDEASTDDDDSSSKQKRHPTSTISPEELEERRQAFIKALGGGEDAEGGGGGGALSSLSGLGSLATDVVMLLTANSNETFAPLREATQKARENFPDIGTSLNAIVRGSRNYVARVYRGLAKNLRTKVTNSLRFILQAVTRLASTVGGLYNVLVSVIDVVTTGVTNGAKFGARLLGGGARGAVGTLAAGTGAIRNLATGGLLLKPFNQAVKVGQGFVKGIGDDLLEQVAWANEGVQSKLQLGQALAPNFLVRAHEAGGAGSEAAADSSGSHETKQLHAGDDDPSLLSLASGSELMMRGGREANPDGKKDSGTTTSEGNTATTGDMMTAGSTNTDTIVSSSTESSNSDDEPPQGLLNDIFGLQQELKELTAEMGSKKENAENKS